MVAFDYEFQASGILERAFLLPMEVYAYGDVVEYERGLREERGQGHRVEVQLIVEHTVICDPSIAPAHLLGAGAV